MQQPTKLRFSGHESFHCRHFWLKKGYDFNEKHPSGWGIDDAVVELGVGKNMVAALDFWLKSFGIKTSDENKELTEIGVKLFNDISGWDPFLEDQGTLWLLQYMLLKTDYASIYKIIFSDYRQKRVSNEFNKTQIKRFLKSKLADNRITPYNDNTANTDLKVFLKSYLPPSKDSKSVEDDFSALFIDLKLLVENVKSENAEQSYKFLVTDRKEIPAKIFLFAILDSVGDDQTSISFSKISDELKDKFLINNDGIDHKLQEIVELYPGTTLNGAAGIKDLQLKGCGDKWNVLKSYYEN